jgi:EmrB/QacA subfamily drug resistance transporter
MHAAVPSELTPGYANRWKALLFIGISLIVISLDNTVLNVALPSISRTLGAGQSELQWIVDAYILVFAALLLTMGALGDRFGRKKALQFGLVMFGLGSLAAALSHTTGLLIASRAFLGIGGATIMPATLSIISATFPPKERPQAIGIWAAIFGLGVGIGPVVGGWLLERFEWNAVFLINLPIVLVALVGGQLFIAESKDPNAPKADIPGVLLSITGLFALVYGIIEAGMHGWTEQNVLLAFGIAFVLLSAFAWWEWRNPNAMLPMHFFKNMSFTAANIALVLVTFSLMGSMFFMSQYFQSVQGVPTLEAGLRVLPTAVTLTIVAAQSARVARRLGTKVAVALGILIAGLALFYMSRVFRIETPYYLIAIGQVLFGVGMGIAMSPATNSIMGSVPVSKAGIGSAMNDTTRQLGGALGVAVLGTIMNQSYLVGVETLRPAIENLLANLPIPPAFAEQAQQIWPAITSSIQGAHIVANRLAEVPLVPPDVPRQIIDTANAAFMTGMNNAMLIGSLIMIGTAVLTYFILPAQVGRSEEEMRAEREASQGASVPQAGGLD